MRRGGQKARACNWPRAEGARPQLAVLRSVVILKHTPGRIMLADLLTKAVARPLHLELLRLFDAYSVNGVVCPS